MEFNGFTLLVLIIGFFAGRGYQKLMAYGERNTATKIEQQWLDNAEESQRDAWLEKYSWRK
jgi:hypothetical protein